MKQTYLATRGLIAILFIFVAGACFAQNAFYEIDELNAGLPDVPRTVDRSTPHGLLSSFLDLSEAGEFDEAAFALNLNQVDASDQSTFGPLLANELYEIVDRMVVLDWSSLLDRPDALDAQATSDSAVAGQVRRSLLLGTIELNNRPYPIYIDRVKPGSADPVWVFSEQSVAQVPKLHDAFGPSELERALPDWARTDALWNLKWWEVLLLPLTLLIALLVGAVAYRALQRMAKLAGSTFVADILVAARLPLVLVAVTTVVSISSGLFIFSGVINTLLFPLIALGYVVASLIFVMAVVDRLIDELVDLDDESLKTAGNDRDREMATKVSMLRRALIVVIFLVGFGIVLAESGVFRTFGFSLLASAGAITLILGFAAREVLSNIMSSMQIALNQSARIGDKVVYKDHLCTVERINFTYVLLRVWTGVRLVVPVTEFVSETFENWTLREPMLMRLVTLRVSHGANVDQLRDVFFEVLASVNQDDLGDEDDHKAAVTDHDVFGQEVTFCVSCSNPNTSWALSCEVRERLIARLQTLESNGSTIFPDANPAEGA